MPRKSKKKIENGQTVWQIKSQDGGVLIILFIFSMVVGFLIYLQTYSIWNRNWPEAEGTVIVHFDHDFKYSYTVGEQKYTKLHYSYLDNFVYHDGDKVKVRYSPEDPMNSRLDLGFSLDVLALALLETMSLLGIAYIFKTKFKQVVVEADIDPELEQKNSIEFQD